MCSERLAKDLDRKEMIKEESSNIRKGGKKKSMISKNWVNTIDFPFLSF